MLTERRTNRSENIMEALGLQLAATARRGGFSALALAESQGILVASTGATAEIEEVVAIAPSLTPGARPWRGSLRLASGCVQVLVMPVNTGDGPLFLCAAGGRGPGAIEDLLRAGLGVGRILA